MKIKQLQLLGYCLVIGLVIILTMGLSACGSSKSPSTTTETQDSSSNTMITTTTTTTKSSSSSKTTTTPKSTAALTSIAISPASPPNLKLSFTQNLIATGTYSDGSNADLSPVVTWHSSDPTIAAFTQPSGGLLQAMSLGTSTITATYQGMTSNSVTITVIGSGLP
jgi:trimeric autotransporter adhesin